MRGRTTFCGDKRKHLWEKPSGEITMSDACPRCGQPVFFAEEVLAFGKKWHKLCMKCANCNKLMDSTTSTEHDGEAFCKACYGKLFGPKGYGFAGGSSGLSMDTGSRYEVTTSNVSHLAKAQAAPIVNSGPKSSQLGGSESCPKCGRNVYFAEEIRAQGRKWHKICLRCEKCNKMLDSTTCNDHGGQVFCKVCYAKLFGPKGYGFAGGASGLSMDTGKAYEIATSNVSHLAQAQAAHVLDGRGDSKSRFGGGEMCPKCGKTVYFAEEIRALGKKWHKLCIRCAKCNKMLDSTNSADHAGDVYCRGCYGKLFGPKGYGFAGGASGLSMDTGKAYEVTRENVSSLAQAQAAPMLQNGSKSAGGDVCPRCGRTVYFAEKVSAGNIVYHKSCFKCSICGKKLDSSILCERENDIFCKGCYGKNFGPTGFGISTAQHT
ncbi:hypothetical protein ScPMuIL_016202 [Solemya velum]